MKTKRYTLLSLLLGCSQSICAQSIALADDPTPVATPISLCQGKSLNLKALNFQEGTLRALGIFRRERYKWTVPEKTKKATKRTGFELNLDNIQVEHAGEYTVYDRLSKSTRKVTVKVNKKPVTPGIAYLLTESRLLVIDTSANKPTATSVFEWTRPSGKPYQIGGVNASVKEFELTAPKVSDLGKYKLTVTADGCTASATTVVSASPTVPPTELKKTVTMTDTTKKDWFFYGNIGGNIDFINRKLGVNSFYTDIQFRPELVLTDKFKLKFPIRIYSNNGAGPEQSDILSQQRFTTIDTVTLAKQKMVRYLIDDPLLTNQTEARVIGLNVPILYAYKLPRNENWSFLYGLNMDFTWTTYRIFGYAYTGGDSTFTRANSINSIPGMATIPGSITVTDGNTVIRNNNIRFDTIRYRPRLPVDRQFRYSQLFIALQAGVEYDSKDYNFSLKYSLGAASTYLTRGFNGVGGYNHVFQVIFFEKSVGLQFLADIRLANAVRDERGILTVPSAPYYYFSLSKTINLSGLKALFFP